MSKTSHILFAALLVLLLAACGRTEINPVRPTSVLTQPTAVPATSAPAADADTTDADADESAAEAALSASIERGEALFSTFYAQVGFACSTCHRVDSEDALVGPGLKGIATRAATRVEGETASEYLHHSIIDPEAYIVEGYPPGVMPRIYADILSAEEIDDIVNYMLSLDS